MAEVAPNGDLEVQSTAYPQRDASSYEALDHAVLTIGDRAPINTLWAKSLTIDQPKFLTEAYGDRGRGDGGIEEGRRPEELALCHECSVVGKGWCDLTLSVLKGEARREIYPSPETDPIA